MRTTAALLILAATCLLPAAVDPQVQQTREDFAAVRPADKDLGIYRLDWVPFLAAAREKAAKGKRPLLVIAVRNAHGDTFTGHC